MAAVDIMDAQSDLELKFQNDQKVLEGLDGQLFLANDTNHCLQQHIGQVLMSPETVAEWQALYRRRLDFFDHHGISFFTLAVPTKESIYDDFLTPEFSPKATYRTQHQFIDAIAGLGRHRIIVLEDELIRARQVRDTFIKTDVHWNEWGAYVGYLTLMEVLRQDLPAETHVFARPSLSEDEIDFREVNFTRGLGIKLSPPHQCLQWISRLKQPRARIVYYNRIPRNGMRVSLENPAMRDAPRLMMFGNSFGPYMLKFLAEHFSRVDFIFSYNIDFNYVARRKPDIVIYQSVERYLVSCPTDTTSLIATEAAKLRQIPQNQVEIYQKQGAANIATGEPDAYFTQALLLLRLKRYSDAFAMYQIALQLNDNPDYHRWFAEFYALAEGAETTLTVKRI